MSCGCRSPNSAQSPYPGSVPQRPYSLFSWSAKEPSRASIAGRAPEGICTAELPEWPDTRLWNGTPQSLEDHGTTGGRDRAEKRWPPEAILPNSCFRFVIRRITNARTRPNRTADRETQAPATFSRLLVDHQLRQIQANPWIAEAQTGRRGPRRHP